MKPLPLIAALALGVALLAGCATEGGSRATGGPARRLAVDARGCVAGTDFVAADLVGACAAVQRGLGATLAAMPLHHQARVAIDPVVNDTHDTLNLAGFDAAVRTQLAVGAFLSWVFLAGNENAEPPETDFFLTGRLQRLRPEEPAQPPAWLYSLQLIDARSSELVWEGAAELKDRAVKAPSAQ